MMSVVGGLEVNQALQWNRARLTNIETNEKSGQGQQSDLELFETHNCKTGEVEKRIKEYGVILEEMSMVLQVISDFKQKDQTV